MPGRNGIDATRAIVSAAPHIAVLVLTMHEDDESVFSAVRAGARGYLVKGARQAELLRALRTVADGGAVFGPAIARRMIGFFEAAASAASATPFPDLTAREREILELVARGWSNQQIAAQLGLSIKTIRNHVSSVFTKIQVVDRAQAIVKAREAGHRRHAVNATPVAIDDRRRDGALAAGLPAHQRSARSSPSGAALLLLALALTRARRRERRACGRPSRDGERAATARGDGCRCCRSVRSCSRGVPRNAIGWIAVRERRWESMLAVAAQEYAIYSHFVDAGCPPSSGSAGSASGRPAPMIALVTVAPLLFPTGRLLVAALAAGAVARPSRRRCCSSCSGALGVGEDLTFLGNPISNDRVHARPWATPASLGWFADAAGDRLRDRGARRATADCERRDREQLRLLLRAAIVVGVAFVACLIAQLRRARRVRRRCGAPWWLSLAFLAGDDGRGDPASSPVRARRLRQPRARLHGADASSSAGSTSPSCSASGACSARTRASGSRFQRRPWSPSPSSRSATGSQRSVNRLLYGQRDEPYAAISSLGRRLGEAIGPTEVLSAMVETIADALRLPYVAVELAAPRRGPPRSTARPDAGVALRLPLVHGGERVGTLILGARAHGEALGEADRRLLEDFARHAAAAVSGVALSERGSTLARAARLRARGGASAAQRRPARRSRTDARRRDPDDRGRAGNARFATPRPSTSCSTGPRRASRRPSPTSAGSSTGCARRRSTSSASSERIRQQASALSAGGEGRRLRRARARPDAAASGRGRGRRLPDRAGSAHERRAPRGRPERRR